MPAATLLLPASDNAWRVWTPRGRSASQSVEAPAEASHLSRPLLIGLPASACRTLGLLVPQADEETLEQLVITQLERRGLKLDPSPAGRNFRWHHLGQRGGQAILSVDVLAEPFPEKLSAVHASDYTAALRLAELPSDQLILLEEQGDLVLAATHRGRLYHSHVFAQAPVVDDTLALELTLARLAIEADLGEGSLTGVSLVGACFDEGLASRLTQALGMPVRQVAELSPRGETDT